MVDAEIVLQAVAVEVTDCTDADPVAVDDEETVDDNDVVLHAEVDDDRVVELDVVAEFELERLPEGLPVEVGVIVVIPVDVDTTVDEAEKDDVGVLDIQPVAVPDALGDAVTDIHAVEVTDSVGEKVPELDSDSLAVFEDVAVVHRVAVCVGDIVNEFEPVIVSELQAEAVDETVPVALSVCEKVFVTDTVPVSETEEV